VDEGVQPLLQPGQLAVPQRRHAHEHLAELVEEELGHGVVQAALGGLGWSKVSRS